MVKKCKPRWKYNHPELSEYYGKVPELDRFDAQFFMVHYRLCNATDAMSRKLLEQAYQAIFDAGVNPAELSGKRVGVYIAAGSSETEKVCSCSEISFGILGCNRAMYANRISYWLNAKGPSLLVDASCCGSLVALEKAYHAMLHGECEAAIVGGSKILLHPQSYIHYGRLIPLNKDGKTKSYDANADGHSKSEAINVIFLQKYKNAKRIYASVCHVKTVFDVSNDKDFGEKYGSYRNPSVLQNFLRQFYEDAGISPGLVEYVEGFGAAVPDTDKAELEAFEKIFCNDRTKPLLIGSLMSNLGYTEAASGTSALVKLLLGYYKGEIAGNLHCDNPRQDIKALREGNMRVITDNQRFERSYTAINCLSVTGINGHALLHGHYKTKNISQYHTDMPYLIAVSGRQESSVQKILNDIKTRRLDPEEIALLHNIHKIKISAHLARGYGIYATDRNQMTKCISEEVDYYDDMKRPLWFVYSGMGSQWAGMGKRLMSIPIFAAAVERCRKILEPRGVDIVHILTSPEKTIYDNILNSFVGIAAIQIGLTDILRAIGIIPDKIIGHSVGELGCAYADGCLTAEEMILSAYSRGLVSIQTPFIHGSMAAVGMGYQQISKICPPEIEVACHNGPDSSTISGPADVMQEFVSQLTAKGIFAKEVPCSNIAYHSHYIAEAGPSLLKYLSDVIKTPKLRSDRWVSTSVPQEKWNDPSAKYSSAEYHTNNLLSPVLFEETSKLVPANAVLVEIAPHGLLQAILKRSLPTSCRHIPLTRRGHADNVLFLLEAIGKLYMQGYDADISALYPKVKFPVSTETRPLSHLVEWVHNEQWNIALYVSANRTHAAVCKPIITIHDDEYKYLSGNIIEGSRVFPFAAALVFVWDTLAMTIGKPRREIPVQFRDIHFHTQPSLRDQQMLHLTVSLQRGSGRFEVTYAHGLIIEGFIITAVTDFTSYPFADDNIIMDMTCQDIYRLLFEKGYEYKDEFRSIYNANMSLNRAQIVWKDNWVTFIDGALQLNVLRRQHNAISQPLYIKRICIDIKKHINDIDGSSLIDAKVYKLQNATRYRFSNRFIMN